MSDDGGWGGGDLLAGMLLGALFFSGSQQPQETGHHHGEHWHTHQLPPEKRHVHVGHLDGPIRVVPPTPEELAAEAERRAEVREAWAGIVSVVAVLSVLLGARPLGYLLLALGLLLSRSTRTSLRRTSVETVEGWRQGWSERPGQKRPAERAASETSRAGQPFVASGIGLDPDPAGRFLVRVEGWSQVTARELHVSVRIWKAEQVVGHAAGPVSDVVAGASTSFVLHGRQRYAGHDRIEVTSHEVQR